MKFLGRSFMMPRTYANILPKEASVEEHGNSKSKAHDIKRRRIGVTVACDRCRNRKIRCDGIRPVCSNCEGKTNDCIYRDEGGLSAESNKLILEIFAILNKLSPQESIRLIHSLTDQQSAWAIMLTLRHAIDSQSELTEGQRQSQGTEKISTPQELHLQNPIAYPVTLIPGRERLFSKPYRELIEPETSATSETSFRNDDDLEAGSSSISTKTTGLDSSLRHELKSVRLCDPRLSDLRITMWTDVEIENDLAARCISLYLETDHPLLAQFDPDLFIEHLISGEKQFCSSLLVNALLYWACMYSAIDERADSLAPKFCAKAEILWDAERNDRNDSTNNIAAAEFLSLGYLGRGKDHSVLKYSTEAAHMGARMGLFSIGRHSEPTDMHSRNLTSEADESRRYAAWGIFNWLTLMSLFYHQPGDICPSSPPQVSVPSRAKNGYMGDTFSHLCQFWTIIREVVWVYQTEIGEQPWGTGTSLTFAEFKFRELLAWSNNLPPHLLSSEVNPHHVHVMHLWLHAAILDIFRPFIGDLTQERLRLRTFSHSGITTRAVVEASNARLKALIVSYRLNYTHSSFTILWHTALIYVANAILETSKDDTWYSYLLFCLYGYQRLSRSWRVARAISKALLSMALRKTNIPSHIIQRLLDGLENENIKDFDEIRAPFLMDLNRNEHFDSATVEHLASELQENMMLRKYTNIFENELN